MPLFQDETAEHWFERAIVVNSIALDRFVMMSESVTPYNPAARQTVQKQADQAQADLLAARTALLESRGMTAEQTGSRYAP